MALMLPGGHAVAVGSESPSIGGRWVEVLGRLARRRTVRWRQLEESRMCRSDRSHQRPGRVPG